MFKGWGFGSKHEANGPPLRCGRCAEVLPDETMSFCPLCGVVFSQVPPTSSYQSLAQVLVLRELKSQQRRTWALTALFFIGFWSLAFLWSEWSFQERAETLSSSPRTVRFHFAEASGFPLFSPVVRRMAIGVALQSFEDHFGMSLKVEGIDEEGFPQVLDQHIERRALGEKWPFPRWSSND